MDHKLLRIMIKTVLFLLGKVIGEEKVVNFTISMSKKLGEYDTVISYAHDNWADKGRFYGGGNSIAIKKVKSDNKITWIHGEPQTFGLTKDRLIRIYSHFQHVIAVSDSVKQQFEDMAEHSIECTRIYNLLNNEEILAMAQSAHYFEDDDKFIIVTVGRLSKIAKRIDKINEIARLLKQDGYIFQWIVVGGGSEYESCVKKCIEYGLDKNVFYLGNQMNPYKYIKESDILVLVSDTEAMPLVINEALVIGTPVVSTNFPAAYESIKDGITGFIVKKDVDSLYSQIAYCINHRECLRIMRNNIN